MALAAVLAGSFAQAQTATDITGLYYTGLASNGGLQAGGQQDANWAVTYASTNGGTSRNTTYQGAAYVITPANVAGSAYTPNTNNAQWITAPGADTSSGTSPNTGGDFLPGNGNTGANEGIFVYTLAFNITGSGSAGTAVTSQIQITMTLAADDQYSVFVNPTGNGVTVPTGSASASDTNAWSNTTQITLQNYGPSNDASFKIGTNYIVVVVDNTNSVTGSSGSTSLNASGLLVCTRLRRRRSPGHPVPEVATWLPLVGVARLATASLPTRRRQSEFQLVRV